MSKRYDARLLIYQALFEVPAQVLLLDAYRQMGKENAKSYSAMALLGIGNTILCKYLAESIYDRIHKSSTDGTYYMSPLTAHTYDVAYENYINKVHSENAQSRTPDQVLKSATGYSKTYMDIAAVSSAAKTAYGTLSSRSSNPLYAVLYGLSQPLCVILEDQGALK